MFENVLVMLGNFQNMMRLPPFNHRMVDALTKGGVSFLCHLQHQSLKILNALKVTENRCVTDWDDEGSLKYRAKSSLFKFVGKQAHNPKVKGSTRILHFRLLSKDKCIFRSPKSGFNVL